MTKALTFLPIAMNNDFLPDELIMNYWLFKGMDLSIKLSFSGEF